MTDRSLRILYRDPDRFPYLALMRRAAAEHGVELTFQRWVMGESRTATGEEWGDLLEHGDVDVIAENYWGLQSYRARGVPFVTLASASNTWVEKLYVDPSIKSLADLAGTRMSLRGHGPQALFPQLWLADRGLHEKVQPVLYSNKETGRWGHWKKVVDGSCQSCFMTPLYEQAVIDAGLVELPYEKYPFVGGHVTLTTTERITEQKRDLIQVLVDASFAASAQFTSGDPIVYEVVAAEARDQLSENFPSVATDDAALRRLIALMASELTPVPIPTADGIAMAHRMRLSQGPELLGFNPLPMWDLSFARSAQRSTLL